MSNTMTLSLKLGEMYLYEKNIYRKEWVYKTGFLYLIFSQLKLS